MARKPRTYNGKTAYGRPSDFDNNPRGRPSDRDAMAAKLAVASQGARPSDFDTMQRANQMLPKVGDLSPQLSPEILAAIQEAVVASTGARPSDRDILNSVTLPDPVKARLQPGLDSADARKKKKRKNR